MASKPENFQHHVTHVPFWRFKIHWFVAFLSTLLLKRFIRHIATYLYLKGNHLSLFFDIEQVFFGKQWLAANTKVLNHFSFPPCLTPSFTTPAASPSHSSNLSPSFPSFPFIEFEGMLNTLKEGATGPRRAPWHAYSRARQT